MRSTACSLAAALLLSSANAWWNNGHMIGKFPPQLHSSSIVSRVLTENLVARVAYDVLNQENPDVLKQAISVLNQDPNAYSKESDSDHRFVECATWADFVKHTEYPDTAGWHFEDLPFYDGVNPSDTDWKPEPQNVTWAIGSISSFLEGNSNPELPTYGTDIPSIGASKDLRFLIHFVGDIHQPLHAETRYTQKETRGDRGGNYFRVES